MKKNELILSVRDLNIKFNLRGKILHAIRGIDLDVYHGEVLAIVGESGSGKSVFTKSFMGLLDSNGVEISGVNNQGSNLEEYFLSLIGEEGGQDA